jgi:CBS domain containing-hemolysin-like protein
MASAGHRGAAAALALTASPGRFLSTIQIGITLISLIAGAFSGATLSEPVALRLARLGLGPETARTAAYALVIGLTMDTSGQYAASGADERLGAMMAIKEFNDKGGLLGRRIEALHMDTETTPATGSRVAERMITRNEAAFLIGVLHSGVANAATGKQGLADVMRLADRPVREVMTPY